MPEINKPSDINKIWANTGDIVTPSDVKISTGWVEEIPPHEYENFVQNKQDLAIAHINQHGVAIWDSVTEYQANRSLVQGSNGRIYKAAKTNSNINPTTDVSGAWYDTNETGMVVFSEPGTYTWVVPAILSSGFKSPKVTVTAGGGSGASGSTASRGAGGGAGGTSIGTLDLTGVTTVTITVGAGGTRRTTLNTNGVTGGNSSFGTLITTVGGNLGQRPGSGAAGGLGGSANGGAINIKGGDGSDSPSGDGGGGSGDGGASFWGGGIRSGTGSSGSTKNNTPGSGGGGGTLISSPGGNGIVVIEW